MTLVMRTSMLLVIALIVACSKPHDVDTPCPDYGRHCPQLPINVPLN